MADISVQKLLYHFTSIKNLDSILTNGILPRNEIEGFADVADHEILDSRKTLGLENYVPFHFFAGSPFDGRVQMDNSAESFVFLTVRRAIAQANNWKIIPRHPLANEDIELLDYEDGMAAIDWPIMNVRDYSDEESKSICMAECLSPQTVASSRIFSIYVKTAEDQNLVQEKVNLAGLTPYININQGMFLAG